MKLLVVISVLVALVQAFPDRNSRIFNGRDARVGEAPYMIQFRQIRVGETFAQHFCGGEREFDEEFNFLRFFLSKWILGSLVNPRWIVSAAHCFVWNWQGRFTFIATAGQHNWRQESPDEQTRNIERIVNHPNYDNQGGMVISPFDINVLRVDRDFVLNSLVRTISLPPPNFIHSGNVQAFGWGVWNIGPPGTLPDILQTATLNIIEFASCRALLDARFPGSNPLHFTDVCTGPLSGSHGACNADSGGPIVQNNPSTGVLELVGVVAWGPSPCNAPDFPSVFARVSAFNDFINQNVN
jgi:secreted trypsin-like serine protease